MALDWRTLLIKNYIEAQTIETTLEAIDWGLVQLYSSIAEGSSIQRADNAEQDIIGAYLALENDDFLSLSARVHSWYLERMIGSVLDEYEDHPDGSVRFPDAGQKAYLLLTNHRNPTLQYLVLAVLTQLFPQTRFVQEYFPSLIQDDQQTRRFLATELVDILIDLGSDNALDLLRQLISVSDNEEVNLVREQVIARLIRFGSGTDFDALVNILI